MKKTLEKLEKKLNDYKKMLEGNLKDLEPHHNGVPELPDHGDIDREHKMKTDKFRNGINVEQYGYEHERMVHDRVPKDVANLDKEETPEPDMASPDKPEGLKNKRKPVTHDECGRPFAKEGDKKEFKSYSEVDSSMKDAMGEADFQPKTKHPLEPTAGMPEGKPKRGERKTSTGFKMKLVKALADAGYRESALLLKNWGEMDKTAEEFVKSNYGPKGMDQYTDKDNIQRKMKNTGEEFADAGKNVNAKKYTTSGSSMQAAHEAAEAKRQADKTKASTKIYTDEEKRALEEKYKQDAKKNDSNGDIAGGNENDDNTRL